MMDPELYLIYTRWDWATKVIIHSLILPIITARKRSLGQGNIFTPVCHSVHRRGHAWLLGGCVCGCSGGMHGCSRGACMVAPRGDMRGCSKGGHAWLLGGMHGCSGGACMVALGGHAWFYLGGMRGFIWGGMRGFIQGGMHGFIRGACMVLFGGHAWFFHFFWIQWDTVNERAVRILLECILVEI